MRVVKKQNRGKRRRKGNSRDRAVVDVNIIFIILK
jgi:hypothetical protein